MVTESACGRSSCLSGSRKGCERDKHRSDRLTSILKDKRTRAPQGARVRWFICCAFVSMLKGYSSVLRDSWADRSSCWSPARGEGSTQLILTTGSSSICVLASSEMWTCSY
jgi:hypothetical protein